MTRKNSLPMTLEQVEKHNAKVRAQRAEPVHIGVDFGKTPAFVIDHPSCPNLKSELKRYTYGGGATGGKTAASEAAMAEFTRKNPGATVARFRHGECIVEKSAGSGSIVDVDAELRSLGVPIDLLLDKGVLAKADLPAIHQTAMAALKRTRMNKLEAEWAVILEARKRAGEIIWYQFEGIRLRLGDGAYFTPDFPVLNADGTLEFQECKGFWREAAKLRIRVAASLYPFWKFYAIRKIKKKDGGGWDIEGF